MILEANTSLVGLNRCHELVVGWGGDLGWIVAILHRKLHIYIKKIIKKKLSLLHEKVI